MDTLPDDKVSVVPELACLLLIRPDKTEVPNAENKQHPVYAALEYESWNRPKHLPESSGYYLACERNVSGGLERAISDYLLRQGKFAESGRFVSVMGVDLVLGQVDSAEAEVQE